MQTPHLHLVLAPVLSRIVGKQVIIVIRYGYVPKLHFVVFNLIILRFPLASWFHVCIYYLLQDPIMDQDQHEGWSCLEGFTKYEMRELRNTSRRGSIKKCDTVL